MSELAIRIQFDRETLTPMAIFYDNAETDVEQAKLRKIADIMLKFLPDPMPAAEEQTMTFTPNRRFKKDYDRLFKKDPGAANVLLLLAELADERGQVRFGTPDPAVEIARLMAARFTDPRAYALPGGPQR